jgi:hypothetical protein
LTIRFPFHRAASARAALVHCHGPFAFATRYDELAI